ncbi:MAG: hypothetical protein KAJ52_02815 [Sedimentisphaerales bacterium]|nr:hypothetical protein [Sedimentisphaerales bacterium]
MFITFLTVLMVGIEHLYQGRFKSFPVQTDSYYLTLMKYVESNPVRAGIVKHSADWPWSSLSIRRGSDKLIALSDGPVKLPQQWKSLVDNIPDDKIGERIAECIKRGQPFGNSDWVMQTVRRLCLESTLKPRGRSQKRCLTPLIPITRLDEKTLRLSEALKYNLKKIRETEGQLPIKWE